MLALISHPHLPTHHGLVWACVLSMALHVGLATLASPSSPQPEARFARQKGAMQVAVISPAPRRAVQESMINHQPPEPNRTKQPRPTSPPRSRRIEVGPTPPVTSQERVTEGQAAPEPTPTPQTQALPPTPPHHLSSTGSPFRNLFAPLSNRPFGGAGSWRRSPTASAIDQDWRMQQAVQMAQSQWQDTLQKLQQTFGQQGAEADCWIQARPEAKHIQLACQSDHDRQRVIALLPPWPAVSTTVEAPSTAADTFCWRLIAHDLTPQSCPTVRPNNSGSPQAAAESTDR